MRAARDAAIVRADMDIITAAEEARAGARLLAHDLGQVGRDLQVGALLADDAWERSITRLVGVPREDQSALVKLVMTAALASVAAGYLPRPPHLPRASVVNLTLGGSAFGTFGRSLAGAPSRAIPAAGLLISTAVVAHALHVAAAEAARDARRAAHSLGASYARARSLLYDEVRVRAELR